MIDDGHKAIGIPDRWGECVSLTCRWERALVLESGSVRVEIHRGWAEVQVTAMAIETEGSRSWYLREMPRWAWWLLVAELEDESVEQLAGQLAELGVKQRRIETCMDVVGLPIRPGLMDLVVSRSAAQETGRPGKRTGVKVGERHSHEHSLELYDKPAQMAAKRGPERAALLTAAREAGLAEGDEWTRIEARRRGKALRLVDAETRVVVVDATHPGAAVDQRIINLLWKHSLREVRLVEPTGAKQVRDRETDPRWVAASEAAGAGELPKLVREQATKAQVEGLRKHHRDQLGQTLATVGVLGGGLTLAQVEQVARQEVDVALADPKRVERHQRARALYDDLLGQVRGDDDDG